MFEFARPQASVRAAVVALMLAATVSAGSARATGASEDGRALPASAKLETDTYLVEIAALGPYKAGAEGRVKVTLTTKGAFHVNPQYPYRFKTAAPAAGVSYPKPILERADGEFAEKTAVFNLPFVASHAGTFEVGGVFHMSVCSHDSCLLQKAALDIPVSVQ